MNKLNIGDTSDNGQITIIDEDRICYLVKSTSKGAVGVRTISKKLLEEYVAYFGKHPDATANDARDALSGNSDIDRFEYGYTSTLKVMAQMVLGQISTTNSHIELTHKTRILYPLQQIFYGAPGTGKSHTINEITEKQPKDNVYRITFHPDSDYSTFVGCYKPSMKRPEKIYTEKKLIAKLKEIKESGVTYPCHKFATKYWESLKDLDAQSIKNILSACGFTDSMAVEVSKGIAIGQELLNATNDGKIVYDFSPQAFTKAYLRAWQTEEPVYLVIEEINRGNCAQIFGDLFQLLDRKNGFSEYPIKADNDLAAYIGEQLSKESREGVLKTVKSGEELVLPPNLYIWATMNTSDQSLFPIDSAFKRRWEWVYMPIDTRKESWYIQIGDSRYSWTDFLNKVNDELLTDETAEDKHLGFYFCKAENGIISKETFVAKVLFYLWTDVFKVYGIPSVIGSGKDWSFAKFYNPDGSVNETKVKELMSKLQIEPVTSTNPDNQTAEIESN